MKKSMYLALRAALLVFYCAALQATAQPAGIATAPDSSVPQSGMTDVPASAAQLHPVHSIQAFGGLLIGTDRGEWIGRLQFQDPAGGMHTILEKNVLGIIQNKDGVFVFTGLDHLGMHEGLLYVVKSDTSHMPRAELLAQLPGTPSRVHQDPGGTTRFLVFPGQRDQQGRFVHECYQLEGQVVSRGAGCLPL
jgi:hypothetical protein